LQCGKVFVFIVETGQNWRIRAIVCYGLTSLAVSAKENIVAAVLNTIADFLIDLVGFDEPGVA
jgi:hypothetical protein